jgi:signal transduction histidine kinase
VETYDDHAARTARLGFRNPKNLMTNGSAIQHTLTNYLAIILGFSELLLQDLPAEDLRRADLEEIHKAATAALELVSSKEFGEP